MSTTNPVLGAAIAKAMAAKHAPPPVDKRAERLAGAAEGLLATALVTALNGPLPWWFFAIAWAAFAVGAWASRDRRNGTT